MRTEAGGGGGGGVLFIFRQINQPLLPDPPTSHISNTPTQHNTTQITFQVFTFRQLIVGRLWLGNKGMNGIFILVDTGTFKNTRMM